MGDKMSCGLLRADNEDEFIQIQIKEMIESKSIDIARGLGYG